MKNNTYPKGFVPRNEDFEKNQKMKQEVYTFLKETMEEASMRAFKALGIECTETHAGEYGDGNVYGAGLGEGGKCNVKVGSKTNSYLEKQISYGGKRMFVESSFQIDAENEIIHMIYRTTEKAVFQGHREFDGGFFVHEDLHMSLSDMKKFKKDMKKILDEAAKKEAAYLTQSKIGVDDRVETDVTQSVVESIVIGDVNSFLSSMDNLFESDGIDEEEQAKEDALIRSKIQEEEELEELKKRPRVAQAEKQYPNEEPNANPNANPHATKKRPRVAQADKKFPDEIDEMTSAGGGAGSAGGFAYDAPFGGGTQKRKMKSSAPFDQPINESVLRKGLTEKGVQKCLELIEKYGERVVAQKMIDQVLGNMISMSSSDLADSAIFAGGLDEIESLLEQKNCGEAWIVAKETAQEMVNDEMGEMGMDSMFEGKGDFDPRFKETPYYQRMMDDTLRGQGNVRLVQEKNEKGDSFWTVVSPEVMKRYEKNHVMGAPGAEGVEPNSKEEEDLAKGHGQKHGGGKKKINESVSRDKKTLDESYQSEYMQIDESVRKRYIPQRAKTQDEISDRWKTLTKFGDSQTIKEAENKANNSRSPFEGREEAKPLNESQLKNLTRNQKLSNGSVVDGRKIISVMNSRNREYLMFEDDATNKEKSFCFDFVTGMRVNNPNFGLLD